MRTMSPQTVTMVTGIGTRCALLGGLWWLFTGGGAAAWLVGVPAIAGAVLASTALSGAALPRLSLPALPGFAWLFLRQSFTGGVDVARRTLSPHVDVQPGFTRYRLLNDYAPARVLMVNCISLLPGTLAARLEGDWVELHLLDMRSDPQPELLMLEQAVAGLFKRPLEKSHD